MRARLYLMILSLAGLGTCSGCGTIYNQRDYWQGRWYRSRPTAPPKMMTRVGNTWWIYGGVVSDVAWFSPQPATMILIADLPFSFAADTLILPMTCIQQIVGRPRANTAASCPYPQPLRGRVIRDTKAIFRAASRYRKSMGRWPDRVADLKEYLQEIPKDPWGRDYQLFELAEWEDGIYVLCLGQDGVDDGEGLDADYLFPPYHHEFPEKSTTSSGDDSAHDSR